MERSDDLIIGNSNSNLSNGDINAVMNAASNNTNNNNNSNSQQSNVTGSSNPDRPANSYTMPGILHFLQHEWNRFEFERQQWEVDRAELMTKISFLQGERRGQENLKNSLIRRIKMLELALKQERVKYHKLKFGVDSNPLNTSSSLDPKTFASSTNQNTQSSSSTEANNNNEATENDTSTFSISQHPILNKENSNTNTNTIKQGRHLLKQYLAEIGYTDTIIDVRSARLRALLGLKSSNNNNQQQHDQSIDVLTSNSNQLDPLANLINGNKQLLQLSSNSNKRALSSPSANVDANNLNGNLNGNSNEVQKILKLTSADSDSLISNLDQFNAKSAASNLNSNNNNNCDEDDKSNNSVFDDDEEMSDDESKSSSSSDLSRQDLDTEDALKEFAFLSSESSSGSSSSISSGSDWNVDQDQLNKLTEQYKRDRKSSKASKQQQLGVGNTNVNVNAQRPNRSTLQAMIANLTDQTSTNDSVESTSSLSAKTIQMDLSPNSSPSSQQKNGASNGNGNGKLTAGNSPKMFNLEDDNFASDASLGELSRISVSNNSFNVSGVNDETIIDASAKTIANKYSLRGHFDSIRCLAFHPTEPVLLSGSEDQTIKLWNLDKSSLNSKKNINTDVEPIYTFRKHRGAVLALLISQNGDFCISSGLDSKIIIWNLPNHETTDQYDAYSPSVFAKYLRGHSDAVWNMALVDNTLVTASADSTIRVWNPFSIDDLNESALSSISCLNEDKTEGVPTSVDFINNEKSRIVTSFGATHHNLYDIETSKILSRFDYFDSTINTHCYKVISHPTSASTSSSLIVSAHEDKKIRFFDINSGKLVYQMVAHQDACTDLAIDPTCFYLLSSSHDCSIRLWNLENKNCIQEMTSHRKKCDESINCVAFHSTKPFIASGGADAVVKIYV